MFESITGELPLLEQKGVGNDCAALTYPGGAPRWFSPLISTDTRLPFTSRLTSVTVPVKVMVLP